MSEKKEWRRRLVSVELGRNWQSWVIGFRWKRERVITIPKDGVTEKALPWWHYTLAFYFLPLGLEIIWDTPRSGEGEVMHDINAMKEALKQRMTAKSRERVETE